MTTLDPNGVMTPLLGSPAQLRTTFQVYLEQMARVSSSEVCDLYRQVLEEVEIPLLEAVMQHTRGNQTKAAAILGINRTTLRHKLQRYELLAQKIAP